MRRRSIDPRVTGRAFHEGSALSLIAIIDYGMGNLHSVSKAVERLGYEAMVTADAASNPGGGGAILPGVGAFGDAMAATCATSGLDAVRGRLCRVRASRCSASAWACSCCSRRARSMAGMKGLNLLPGEVVRFRGDTRCRIWAGIG